MNPASPAPELAQLKRHGPVFLSLWGWALLAMSVAHNPYAVGAAVVGFVAAVVAFRAFATSALVEGAALVVIIWCAQLEQLGYVALGAGLVVIARGLAALAKRAAG